MKNIGNIVALGMVALMILQGCSKDEPVAAGTGSENGTGTLKGKPVAQPPYILAQTATPMQVYGVWHAGNDYCTWGEERSYTEFDAQNHWLIDRGDDDKPSVNLVVLSFVNPLKLLHGTDDATTVEGVPKGMNETVVNYFKSKEIRVMLSIGGITYTDDWNAALAENPVQLATNAAAVAERLGVGIEIDYEENTNPNLAALQAFIDRYRELHPYDPSGANHAARLTIDLAAGDRWLIAICRTATADWLLTDRPVLDYANAMVPARQPSASGAISNWDEHIDGKPQYAPPIPPLAPCKFTGALYITDSKRIPECVNFYSSIQYLDRDFVTRIVSPIPDMSQGMLGYMFWAAECPSTRSLCTTGNNTCEGGVGQGAGYFKIPVPMPPLRQN